MHSYHRLRAAESLLRKKAELSPGTDQANAHALIVEAREEIERWMIAAGDLVQIPFAPEKPLASSETAVRSASSEMPSAVPTAGAAIAANDGGALK